MNPYQLLHPEILDETIRKRTARVADTDYEPIVSPEQAMANMIDAAAERGNSPPLALTQTERLRAAVEQREREEAAAREAAKANSEAELIAADAMHFCWRTGTACQALRNDTIQASKLFPPYSDSIRLQLPSRRAAALAELVDAVKNTPRCEAFKDERLQQEAEIFLREFEQPTNGDGSRHYPTAVAGSLSMGGTGYNITRSLALTGWYFLTDKELNRLRIEEQARLRQQRILAERGYH
ncbi:MAG: hypothetical protein ACYC3I_06470 [Gemmataceae bacterium]